MKQKNLIKNNWTIYNEQVLLIKLTKPEDGHLMRFQYDGLMVQLFEGYGVEVGSFKTKYYLFTPKYWLTHTRWFLKERLLLFIEEKNIPNFESLNEIEVDSDWSSKWDDEMNKLIEPFREQAKSDTEILSHILGVASERLGIKLEKEETEYGKDWFEAYIPLTYNNEEYVLTWMNCD